MQLTQLKRRQFIALLGGAAAAWPLAAHAQQPDRLRYSRTSRKRVGIAADIPTVAEAGYLAILGMRRAAEDAPRQIPSNLKTSHAMAARYQLTSGDRPTNMRR